MDFNDGFINAIYVLLVMVLMQMMILYPFMILFFAIAGGCYVIADWYKRYGWVSAGKIHTICIFNDAEKRRHFIVYRPNENNENVVIHDICASGFPLLLTTHIDKTKPIQAVRDNGEIVNIYSLGPLVSHHLTIMAEWYHKGSPVLWLGILQKDWNYKYDFLLRNDKFSRDSYVMLDVQDPEKDIFTRFKNPHEDNIFGQSNHYKISLKIQKKIYRDIFVSMHVYEDPHVALYENFWMFGIQCSTENVDKRLIALGDEVHYKLEKRSTTLFH